MHQFKSQSLQIDLRAPLTNEAMVDIYRAMNWLDGLMDTMDVELDPLDENSGEKD